MVDPMQAERAALAALSPVPAGSTRKTYGASVNWINIAPGRRLPIPKKFKKDLVS